MTPCTDAHEPILLQRTPSRAPKSFLPARPLRLLPLTFRYLLKFSMGAGGRLTTPDCYFASVLSGLGDRTNAREITEPLFDDTVT